jgi:TolB-like protein
MEGIMYRVSFSILVLITFFLLSPSIGMTYEKEVQSLSLTIAEKVATADKKRIAVVDFTDLKGNVTELGRFLAEEFSVSLAGLGKGFEVVDRTHLKSIIAEHKLSTTGIIDPQTARKLGKIAGVEALVTGTITPFGDSVRLAIKVLDTNTARVITGITGNIAKTKAIEELLASGITTPIPPGQPPVGKEVEAEGFIFRPVGCERSGNKVICTVSFQNNGSKEQELNIKAKRSPYSHLYDNFGNQYPVLVQIGHNQSQASVSQKFIPQLPVNVQFVAEDIASKATHMTVTIGIEEFKNLIAVRNIPISQ